jgi:peptidoglycan/LPS O-acetylase OafA/YrhL
VGKASTGDEGRRPPTGPDPDDEVSPEDEAEAIARAGEAAGEAGSNGPTGAGARAGEASTGGEVNGADQPGETSTGNGARAEGRAGVAARAGETSAGARSDGRDGVAGTGAAAPAGEPGAGGGRRGWGWPEPPRPSMPALAGLRGVAAVAVAASHVAALTTLSSQPGWLAVWLTPTGLTAVVLFFLLSGFLILGPLLRTHQEGRPRPSVLRFFAQRALRVYPTYWFILVVAVVVFEVDRFTAGEWPLMLSLTYVVRDGMFPRGLFVAWTLAVEMVFYLVAPLVVGAMYLVAGPGRSVAARRRVQGVVLCLAPVALVLVAVASRLAADGSSFAAAVASSTPLVVTALVVGCACAYGLNRGRPPAAVVDLARRPWLCVLVAGGLYWLVTLLDLPLGLVGVAPAKGAAWYTFLSIILSLVLVLPAVVDRKGTSAYHRFLGSTPLLWLGELSYGIYLWHMPVLGLLARRFEIEGRTAAHVPALLGTLALSVVMAVLSYVLVEQPVRRLSRRLVGSMTTVARSASGPAVTAAR